MLHTPNASQNSFFNVFLWKAERGRKSKKFMQNQSESKGMLTWLNEYLITFIYYDALLVHGKAKYLYDLNFAAKK